MELTREWIEEFNRKCARFMGFVKWFEPIYQIPKEFCHLVGIELGLRSVYDLKFHSDWNWIMEVKHHIVMSGHPVFQFPSIITIKENQTLSAKNICKIDFKENEKEAIVQAIDQFIDWYNKQKKS